VEVPIKFCDQCRCAFVCRTCTRKTGQCGCGEKILPEANAAGNATENYSLLRPGIRRSTGQTWISWLRRWRWPGTSRSQGNWDVPTTPFEKGSRRRLQPLLPKPTNCWRRQLSNRLSRVSARAEIRVQRLAADTEDPRQSDLLSPALARRWICWT